MMNIEHTIINQTKTSILIEVPLTVEMKIFDGHFNQMAIMPAVAQLYFVECFARKLLSLDGQFTSMRQLKFVDAICPNTSIQISIEHHLSEDDTDQQIITFTFYEGDVLKSKGRLHYNA